MKSEAKQKFRLQRLLVFQGVSLIATAHAKNLRKAANNDFLQPLFGGLETSMVSDETAKHMFGATTTSTISDIAERGHFCHKSLDSTPEFVHAVKT